MVDPPSRNVASRFIRGGVLRRASFDLEIPGHTHNRGKPLVDKPPVAPVHP